MTAKEPTERPTAKDALKRLKSIVSIESYFTLRRRLVGQDEVKSFNSIVYENVGILMNTALLPVKFSTGIPSQTLNAMRRLMDSKPFKTKNP